MNVRAATANALWAAVSLPAWRRFRSALDRPGQIQRELLVGYLRDNQHTSFGTQHGFGRILRSRDVVAAYQSELPISDYDTTESSILRVAAGASRVLTRSPVTRLTPSSGSTAAAKLLPQTEVLSREFSRAVDPWIADLYLNAPSLAGGPAYWSITPSASFERVAAARLGSARPAVPVGFDDDSAYLGAIRQWLVSAVLAVPADVRRIADPAAFRYVTLLFLVRARDLRLVSVWHPSFFTQLIESAPQYLERLSSDLNAGTLTPPGELPDDVRPALTRCLRPLPRRAAELRRLRSLTPRDFWPALKVVSCWSDGPARPYARRLAQSLAGVVLQPKGLIATEAVVSIPFERQRPLAIASHFFEFVDDRGRMHLADDLDLDSQYTVVVSTGGGLYRYNLGDRILVTGRVGATPSIEFLGRADRVSDRFGEKLSEGFVSTVLDEIFSGGPVPRFAMVTPESTVAGTAYTLLVEPDGPLPDGLAHALERGLRRNPHYAWCVDLGQLMPARVKRVGPNADRTYLDACVARGQKLGDIKPVALQTEEGWERTLGV